jgi:uncharacterized protein YjiS (DUF1127 family)
VNLSENTFPVSITQRKYIHAVSIWLSRVQAGFGRLAEFLATRHRRIQEAEVLYGFSDRDLWDLGLSRSDIPGIINGMYRRDCTVLPRSK